MTGKASAGFRIDQHVYDEVKTIADTEKRSVASILSTMVEVQVARYKKGSWALMTNRGAGNE